MAENEIQNTNVENEEKKKHNKVVAWWMGLKNPVKIAICAATGVGVASAVIFPILGNTVWAKKFDGVVSEEQWKTALTKVTAENLNENSNFTMYKPENKSSNGSSGDKYFYINGFNIKEKKEESGSFVIDYTMKYDTKLYVETEEKAEGETGEFNIKEIDNSFKEEDVDTEEINNYTKFKFNETTHFYERHIGSESTNGSDPYTLRFKFDSSYNLCETQTQKDGKTDISCTYYSNYGTSEKFNIPAIANFVEFNNKRTVEHKFTNTDKVFFKLNLKDTGISTTQNIYIDITDTSYTKNVSECDQMYTSDGEAIYSPKRSVESNRLVINANTLKSNSIIYFSIKALNAGTYFGSVSNS